jgi:hypothetical protein
VCQLPEAEVVFENSVLADRSLVNPPKRGRGESFPSKENVLVTERAVTGLTDTTWQRARFHRVKVFGLWSLVLGLWSLVFGLFKVKVPMSRGQRTKH